MVRLSPKQLLLPSALTVLLLCSVLSPPLSAQLSNLDAAGKRFASEFKALKPHPAIVNVADFSSSDNVLLPQAHYLAWYLSSSLEVHGKTFLRVPDHLEFDKNVAKLEDSSNSALLLADLPKLGSRIGGDYIIAGTVEKTGSSFIVGLAALRVSDGTLVDSGTVEVRSSEFLDSLSAAITPEPGQTLYHSGVNGVGMPTCSFHPDPAYTSLARAKGLNGVVVMQALISSDGRIQQIQLIRMLGYGIDEQAYNTVKAWKCKPAKDRQGNPVAVTIPIEVTFRLN